MLPMLGPERFVVRQLLGEGFNKPADRFPVLGGTSAQKGKTDWRNKKSAIMIGKAGMMLGCRCTFICLKYDLMLLV